MIPLDQAWSTIAAQIEPSPPVEHALVDLQGLVLAQDVASIENVPPFAASTMDGYAVIASDETTVREVLGEQDAGYVSHITVMPGTAMRIMTGAPLPAGADAVIPVEDTVETDVNGKRRVELRRPVRLGEYVRPIGSDMEQGQIALAEGTVIGPAEIGVMATLGITRALAFPRPRVMLLVTGDELVAPKKTPGPGQIRDSNSFALAAAVTACGGIAIQKRHIADSTDALRVALLEAAQEADVIITSGGMSMGTKDLIKPVLESIGEVHFGRVAIKPGKPLTYATIQGTAFFGLPGNPVSTLVCFENIVRPTLRIMMGHKLLWRPEITVTLSHSIRHAPDRTEFQRAAIESRDDMPYATTTGAQASSRLLSLVGANALLRIPRGTGDMEAGQSVSAILINQPEIE